MNQALIYPCVKGIIDLVKQKTAPTSRKESSAVYSLGAYRLCLRLVAHARDSTPLKALYVRLVEVAISSPRPIGTGLASLLKSALTMLHAISIEL